MDRKLGIVACCLHGVPEKDALCLIKEAGFDCTFLGSYQMDRVIEIKKEADRLGLGVEFIHAPFGNINNMWLPGDNYLTIFNQMTETIDSAAANAIPVVVTHVSSGWNAPQVNDLGLARYDALVRYAKKKGVVLAFENLRMLGNLACLVDRYENEESVAFCYDCGHEHCYTKTIRWMDVFTTRVCCTHIHDNFSRELGDKTYDPDLHLLPFDGTYDYAQMMRELDKYGYRGSLMLELGQHRPEYLQMTSQEFLTTAYERIKRISEM